MGSAENNVKYQTNEHRSSDEIKRDLDETRSEMDETIDALVRRLDPGAWVSRAWHGLTHGNAQTRERARETGASAAEIGNNVMTKIRNNPVPTALIGAGAAWLLMSGDDDQRHRWDTDRDSGSDWDPEQGQADIGEYAGGATESAKSRARHAGSRVAQAARSGMASAKSGASGAAASATHAGRSLMSGTQSGARGASWQARRTAAATQANLEAAIDDYPLAVGAAVMGLGMAVGMLIPESRREHEMLGPSRDRLKEQSKDAMNDVVERGKDIAQTTAAAAQDKLEEEGLDPAHLAEKTQAVAAHAKQAAEQKMHDEQATPEAMKRKAEEATGTKQEHGSKSVSNPSESFPENR